MIIKQLQFITHETRSCSYLNGALAALQGGCRWIQLRMKDASDAEVEQVAMSLMRRCRELKATFILDDRVALAKQLGADGVHLGKNDMSVAEARILLGPKAIIGGTANTFEDVKRIADADADYIGCGPFRFTTTKQELSPVLGLEGYRNITNAMRVNRISLPIVAIGGITLADVLPIMQTGVDGIAVSGAILNAKDSVRETTKFLAELRNMSH